MWEIRSEPRTHTTSLVMSWVAVERMMRVARRRGLPGDLTELAATRDQIYERVMTDCWNEELGAFTAFADSDVLDAGALLMPMVKMLAPDDPRFLSTLAAIEDRLVTDSLVLRYDPTRSATASPPATVTTAGTTRPARGRSPSARSGTSRR